MCRDNRERNVAGLLRDKNAVKNYYNGIRRAVSLGGKSPLPAMEAVQDFQDSSSVQRVTDDQFLR